MKRTASLVAVVLGTYALAAASPAVPMSKVGGDCTFGGKKLYGDVKVVTAFPDFKVKRVTAFPDLKVKVVTAFPDSCGRWKMVDAFPDFTVQWVDAFPDFEIEYVDAFPGVN